MTTYNIKDRNGRLMLGQNVDIVQALSWLTYYRTRYAAGKPYPNGMGCYSDLGFQIVSELEQD